MKTWNQFVHAGLSLLFLIFFALPNSSATAQTVTLMSTQDFSSSSFPSGWTGSYSCNSCGAWYWDANGDGGSNGSAGCDIWDYSTASISPPAINASTYANDGDSVWVDFDFCWEYSGISSQYPDDHFEMFANSDRLLYLATSTDYTYSDPSDSYYQVDAQTSSADWRHYHVLIPVADRNATLTISFEGVAAQGITNPFIDNVNITAYFKTPGEFSLLPKSLDFGAATPNAPVTLCVTAYSLGTGPVHITGYGVSGSASYSLVSGPMVGDSIMPGNTAQYCIQFLPLSGGTLTGAFTLVTDAADSGKQAVSLTGFGAVPGVSYGVTSLFHHVNVMLSDTSPEEYIPVTSNGGGPLHFNNIYFIGLNANNYFVSRMPQNPLPVDVTDSIGIRFAPRFEGRPDASVIISTDAANQPLDTVSLFGVGVLPHYAITVQPPGSGNTVNFDSVKVGDSACQQIMIQNIGSDTLQIVKQLVTYGDYDFTYHPLTGADTSILPGDSVFATVCFKPLRNGTRLATLRFFTNIPRTFEKPARDTGEFDIQVTGIGVPVGNFQITSPVDILGQNRVDTITVNSTVCQTDTLWNTGQADLTVTSLKVSGADSAEFLLTPPTLPLLLAAGTHQTFTVCATPTAINDRLATLTGIAHSGETLMDTASLALDAYGVSVCSSNFITSEPALTCVGDTSFATITVTNCGNVATSYTASVSPADFSIVGSASSPSESAGGEATFTVAFGPQTKTPETGTVTITGGSGGTVLLIGISSAAAIVGDTSVTTAVGTAITFPVTVYDTGTCDWTPGVPQVSAPFSYVSGGTTPILAGGTGTLTFTFAPTTAGTVTEPVTFPNAAGVSIPAAAVSVTGSTQSSSVAEVSSRSGYSLEQNHPNPFIGKSEVEITLPQSGVVQLVIVDLTGKVVETVLDQQMDAGTFQVTLDASELPSGTYFYTLTSGNVRLTRQLSLIK